MPESEESLTIDDYKAMAAKMKSDYFVDNLSAFFNGMQAGAMLAFILWGIAQL